MLRFAAELLMDRDGLGGRGKRGVGDTQRGSNFIFHHRDRSMGVGRWLGHCRARLSSRLDALLCTVRLTLCVCLVCWGGQMVASVNYIRST